MKKNKVYHTLEPYYQKDSQILILGTMPSTKSRELGFYYMHPKNRFWKVLSMVYQEPILDTIEAKKEFLKKHKIALWDVIQSCDIIGSSDSSITNVIANDIPSLLNKTEIKTIYTTGKKAYQLYQKYIDSKTKINAILLPSTSPANAIFTEEKLYAAYLKIKGEQYETNSEKKY